MGPNILLTNLDKARHNTDCHPCAWQVHVALVPPAPPPLRFAACRALVALCEASTDTSMSGAVPSLLPLLAPLLTFSDEDALVLTLEAIGTPLLLTATYCYSLLLTAAHCYLLLLTACELSNDLAIFTRETISRPLLTELQNYFPPPYP